MPRTMRRSIKAKPDSPCSPSVLYDRAAENWMIVIDLLGGTQAMREAGTAYLPMEPAEKLKAYQIRLNRSFLFNGYKGGVSKIVSYPFSRPVDLQKEELLPEGLAELHEDVTGGGTTLTHFARDFFESMIALGHAGVFVDYTDVIGAAAEMQDAQEQAAREAEGAKKPPRRARASKEAEDEEKRSRGAPERPEVSQATEEAVGARPVWRLLKCTDIIGWNHDEDGRLVELRWREVKVERAEGKRWVDEEREYVHVWTPTTWEIWRSKVPLRDGRTVLAKYLGTDVVDWVSSEIQNFKPWRRGVNSYPDGIPFKAAYANKTGEMMSEPPLMELAQTCLEHWQSNSDQRNILRFARLAQKVISGVKAGDLEKDNLVASVHNVIKLRDPAAQAYYLEHSGSGIEAGRNDMKDLQERMAGQGLQPLVQRSQVETATATMVDLMNVTTDAQAWVAEAQETLRWAYGASARWTGQEIGKEFTPLIYRDFVAAISGGADFGFIENMQKAGILTKATVGREAQRRGILSEVVDVEAEIEAAAAEMEEAAAKAMAAGAGGQTLEDGGTGHTHTVALDEAGNGTSSPGPEDGHVHEVVANEVQPGGEDGHTHPLGAAEPEAAPGPGEPPAEDDEADDDEEIAA